jgi:hypothetical protein
MPLFGQDEEEKNKAKEEKRQARDDAAAKIEERRQAMAAEGKPLKGRPRKNAADGKSRARTEKTGDGACTTSRARAVKEKELGSEEGPWTGEASKRSDRSMDKGVDQKKRKTKDAVDKDKEQKKRKTKDASQDVNPKKRKTKDAVDSQDVDQKRSKKNADKGEDCGTDPKRKKILDNMSLVQKTEILELDTILGDRKTYTVRPPQEKKHEVKGIGVVLQSQSFYVNKVVLPQHLWPGDMAKLYKVGAQLYDMLSCK